MTRLLWLHWYPQQYMLGRHEIHQTRTWSHNYIFRVVISHDFTKEKNSGLPVISPSRNSEKVALFHPGFPHKHPSYGKFTREILENKKTQVTIRVLLILPMISPWHSYLSCLNDPLKHWRTLGCIHATHLVKPGLVRIAIPPRPRSISPELLNDANDEKPKSSPASHGVIQEEEEYEEEEGEEEEKQRWWWNTTTSTTTTTTTIMLPLSFSITPLHCWAAPCHRLGATTWRPRAPGCPCSSNLLCGGLLTCDSWWFHETSFTKIGNIKRIFWDLGIYTCMYVCMYVCMYIYIYVCVNIYI